MTAVFHDLIVLALVDRLMVLGLFVFHTLISISSVFVVLNVNDFCCCFQLVVSNELNTKWTLIKN